MRSLVAATKETTMTSSTPLPWEARDARHPAHEATRQLAARALRSASAVMTRLALRLAEPVPHPPALPQREFHAEAGAPEGALYLDGRFVGWIQGVTRL
jgi:hypothetical protein